MEHENPMTQPADPTARIRERLAETHAAYERTLAEWADTELGTNKSILLEDEMDRLTTEIVGAVPALLAENERLFAGVEAAYKWLDENCNDIPLTGIDVWRLLKPLLEAAHASDESGVTG